MPCGEATALSWPALPRLLRTEADFLRLTQVLVDHERIRRNHRGRPFDLRAMRRLDRSLGKPHRAFGSIHVAGSKGKGSVCAFLEALLSESGLRVGAYFSPHVDSFAERVRLGGLNSRLAELGTAVQRVLKVARQDGLSAPTFFETLTAAAFAMFADRSVDLAVIETGIGGRLDATNVLDSAASVIASIELEHCAILGPTLSDIAREKAGILRTGRPAILGVSRGHRAASLLRSRAMELGCQPWQWGREIRLVQRRGRAVLYLPERPALTFPAVPLGPHGPQNLALAVAALVRLGETAAAQRFAFASAEFWHTDRLALAMQRVRLPGRAEVLAQAPRVIRDGAHTPRSIASLVRWLTGPRIDHRVVLVFGMLADKDPRACLAGIRARVGPLIATEVPGGRSYSPERIAGIARKLGIDAEVVPDLRRALEVARRRAGPRGTVLVTGSFWLAGAVPGALEISPAVSARTKTP